MLILMRGGYVDQTLPQLRKIEIPERGERSNRWRGIQHGEFVDELIHTLKEDHNLGPINPTYSVNPNGNAMIGGFELGRFGKTGNLNPLKITGLPQKATQAIAFQHSNDSRKSLTVYMGGRVAICTNGLVTSSVTFRRRHTSGLHLQEWLSECVAALIPEFANGVAATQHLREHEVSSKDHDKLILNLGRNGIIPWRLMEDVDLGWSKAKEHGILDWVPEGTRDSKWDFEGTLWDYYNVVTHVAKMLPPVKQLEALERGFTACQQIHHEDFKPVYIPEPEAEKLEKAETEEVAPAN